MAGTIGVRRRVLIDKTVAFYQEYENRGLVDSEKNYEKAYRTCRSIVSFHAEGNSWIITEEDLLKETLKRTVEKGW